MPTHTVSSISASIFQNFPHLTSANQDDLLALLEELEKNYGPNFFDERLTLPNAIRITATNYIVTRNIFMDMTGENIGDVLALHPILAAQEPVFQKIDLLHEVKNSFPQYPITNLSSWREKTLVIKVADLNLKNKVQLFLNRPIGEMLIANPKMLYYFMPKGEK